MTSSELLVRNKNKKEKRKKKSRDRYCAHARPHGHYNNNDNNNNNNNVAFHSVILQIDAEKETKRNFRKCLSRKSNVFIVSVYCVTQRRHLQSRKKNKKKFPVWLDGIGQHPVADACPKKRDDASFKQKLNNHKRNSTRTSSSSYH